MAQLDSETYIYSPDDMRPADQPSEAELLVINQVRRLIPGFVAFGLATLLLKLYG